MFFAHASDARRALNARAMIQGTKKYQAFKISEKSGGELTFERLR